MTMAEDSAPTSDAGRTMPGDTGGTAVPENGPEPQRESLIDAIADLLQMLVDWIRTEANDLVRDKLVLPMQQLGDLADDLLRPDPFRVGAAHSTRGRRSDECRGLFIRFCGGHAAWQIGHIGGPVVRPGACFVLRFSLGVEGVMGRALRMYDADGCYFVTARTFQSRLLLQPTRRTREVLGGVLARAARLCGVQLYAFVAASNHVHLLCRVRDGRLSAFMQYLLANISKKAGPLVGWRGQLWERRFSAEPVLRSATSRRP